MRIEILVLRGLADQTGLIVELRCRSDARGEAERQDCRKKSHFPPPGERGTGYEAVAEKCSLRATHHSIVKYGFMAESADGRAPSEASDLHSCDDPSTPRGGLR